MVSNQVTLKASDLANILEEHKKSEPLIPKESAEERVSNH